MYQFNYHSPKNVDEAINIYNSCEDPKFLAGGNDLNCINETKVNSTK